MISIVNFLSDSNKTHIFAPLLKARVMGDKEAKSLVLSNTIKIKK